MSQTITLELDVDLYAALQRRAAAKGHSMDDYIRQVLQRGSDVVESARATAAPPTDLYKSIKYPEGYVPGPLDAFFGCCGSGEPRNTTNEEIDAILAEEAVRGLNAH